MIFDTYLQYKREKYSAVLIIIALLFVSDAVYTADISTANVSFVFRNPDNTQTEPYPVPKDALSWSKTITTMLEGMGFSDKQIVIKNTSMIKDIDLPKVIEDFGRSNEPIPLNNISKETFVCLQDLMIATKDPLTLEDPKLPLIEITNKFKAKLHNNNTYKTINRRDLYLAAHYFDAHNKIKNAIASLYVDTFNSNNPPKIVLYPDNTVPSFDDMPLDMYPFIAGWLLHKLITHETMLPVFESKELVLDDGLSWGPKKNVGQGISNDPIISSSGSNDSFVSVWRERAGYKCRYALFNLAEKKWIQRYKLENIAFISSVTTKCALSHDSNYMLIMSNGLNVAQSVARLYNISKEAVKKTNEINSQIVPHQVLHINHDMLHVISVLFDGLHNVFKVIAYKIENHRSMLYSYTVDPRATKEENERKSVGEIKETGRFHLHYMHWSCIDGVLIGVTKPTDAHRGRDVVLIQGNKLIKCTFNAETESWGYKDDEDTFHDANFDVIEVMKGESKIKMAIRKSCIPDFAKIISDRLHIKAHNYKENFYGATFDPNNIHINCWKKNKDNNISNIGIYYPYDQKLVAALNLINKKVIAGDNVLFDVYFLWQYYTNPAKWYISCKLLVNPKDMLISPEIQKIFGLDQLIDNPLKHTLEKPKSFWEAYKRGAFWNYTKQWFHKHKLGEQSMAWAFMAGTTLFWFWSKSKSSNSLKSGITGK